MRKTTANPVTNRSKLNIAQVTRWYLSHLSRWRSWRVHLVIIHFVGNSQPKGTKNAAEKDGRAPNGRCPKQKFESFSNQILAIFRTKLAVSFRGSVFKGRSFERNPCRQRGDFIWWLFSFFLSCLTFVKVFMENYQHLFLSDCLPPRFSKSIILNE